MTVPEFLRFYSGYTASSLMQEYLRTFYALVNEMFRLRALEIIDMAMASNPNKQTMDSLQKQAKGLSGIVKEVKLVKKLQESGNE